MKKVFFIFAFLGLISILFANSVQAEIVNSKDQCDNKSGGSYPFQCPAGKIAWGQQCLSLAEISKTCLSPKQYNCDAGDCYDAPVPDIPIWVKAGDYIVNNNGVDGAGVGIGSITPNVLLTVGDGADTGDIIAINGDESQYVGLRINDGIGQNNKEKWFIGHDISSNFVIRDGDNLVDRLSITPNGSMVVAGGWTDVNGLTVKTNDLYIDQGNVHVQGANKGLKADVVTTTKICLGSSGCKTDWNSVGMNNPMSAAGEIIYGGVSGVPTKLSAGASGNALLSNGSASPSWGKVGLTTHVSGILPVTSGGTGVGTVTGIMKGNGTTAVTAITNSSGLAGAISDETGTGSLVYSASPTLTGNVNMPGGGIWNSTGHVGIGTNSPGGSSLVIAGGDLNDTGTTMNVNENGLYLLGGNTTGGHLGFRRNNSSASANGNVSWSIYERGFNGSSMDGDFRVWNSIRGNNVLNIAASTGNVGIGYEIYGPTEVLVVDATGNSNVTARLKIQDSDGGDNPELQLQYGSNSNDHWAINVDKSSTNDLNIWSPGSTNALTIKQNGNVGIGTNLPGARLGINNAGGSSFASLYGVNDGYQYSGIHFYDGSVGSVSKLWQFTHRSGLNMNGTSNGEASNSFALSYYNGSNWLSPMTVLPNGNVGIGITNFSNIATYGSLKNDNTIDPNRSPGRLWVSDLTAGVAPSVIVNGPADGGASITFAANGVARGSIGSWFTDGYLDIGNYTPNRSVFIWTTGATGGAVRRVAVDSNGNMGVGVVFPNSKVRLDVAGAVKIGDTSPGTTPCNSGLAGAIKYVSSHFYGCNGTTWKQLDN